MEELDPVRIVCCERSLKTQDLEQLENSLKFCKTVESFGGIANLKIPPCSVKHSSPGGR